MAMNGVVLRSWYGVLDRHLGSDRQSIRSLLAKCLADQMVYAPFAIASFVSFTAALNGGGARKILNETRQTMHDTFLSTWLMDWKIWPAANIIMFRFVQSSYRPSCASVVQVVWQTYLSTVNFDPHSIPAISPETTEIAASRTAKASEAARGGGKGDEGMGMMTPAMDTASVLPCPSLNRSSDDNGSLPSISYRRHMTTRYAYRPRDDMKELKDETSNDQEASSDVDCRRSGKGMVDKRADIKVFSEHQSERREL